MTDSGLGVKNVSGSRDAKLCDRICECLLAELGDKTQLATLLFATSPDVSRTGIFLAAASALVLSSAVAVLVGGHLAAWLPPRQLKMVAGLAFIAIGLWVIWSR